MTSSYDEIIPNLYIGNETASYKYGYKFDTIINCTHTVSFPDGCKTCIRLAVDDTPDEAKRLFNLIKEEHVLEIINRQLAKGNSVLVHCHAGMQRSCSVVACYLVKYYDMTSYEAISFIRAKRHIAFLYSINFLETINLVLFDNKNKNKNNNKNNNKKIDL